MSQKCVHKGCGKLFSNPEEPCTYHPGPPVFHEGQKGWKCCKPRVLTFDEFMTIPPCTTGAHSTVDDTPALDPPPSNEDVEAKIKAQREKQENLPPAVSPAPIAQQAPRPTPSPAPPELEEEDDDPSLPVPDGATCKRKACGKTYKSGQSRETEECVHHPGQPLFHEGSKGWTCCKRRVLEFDEFLKLPGCTTKSRHLFLGAKKRKQNGLDAGAEEEEIIKEVRNDFYQTATTVIASLYLKKIDRERSRVEFTGKQAVELELHTSDGKRYETSMTTFGSIEPERSSFKIMGTKLELTLAKADGSGWPVLRVEDPHTGELIQAGRAGRV
ncbi:hypothetical protein LTR35_016870 [Friedmanniomyces endolithicus]|nr:hypothetical protein LTR35_016870 [Friedmanniomyces endolithicus]KAK0273170.1 hypothetical protein LTS00_015924 [Friedmanniomyces endolithicus]KAK1000633.1 hypothetical protein LTR54_008860 [Friedmanniomyces endolithicus]